MADIPFNDLLHNIVRVAIPSQNLASGALSFTSSVGKDFRLVAIYLKSTAAISQVLTVSKVINGTLEVQGERQTSSNDTDFYFVPENTLAHLKSGDEIKVECSNTGTPAASISGFFEYEEI